MKNDFELIAGVGPNGMSEDYEVKILICYLMYRTKQSFLVDDLKEILVFSGLVNHFIFIQCINELESLEHIVKDENNMYFLTEKGENAAKYFFDSISESIKTRAMETAKEFLRRKEFDNNNAAVIKEVEDGYNLTLNLGDGESNLMSLDLFVPDKKHCQIMKDNFYEDPGLAYKIILAYLTGDMNSVYVLLAQKMLNFPENQ